MSKRNAAKNEQTSFPFAKANKKARHNDDASAVFEFDTLTLYGSSYTQPEQVTDGSLILQRAIAKGFASLNSTEVLFQTSLVPSQIPGIQPLASCYQEFCITKVEISFNPSAHKSKGHESEVIPPHQVTIGTGGNQNVPQVVSSVTKYDRVHNGIMVPGKGTKQDIRFLTTTTAAGATLHQPLGDPAGWRGRHVLGRAETASGIDFTKPFRNNWYPRVEAGLFHAVMKHHLATSLTSDVMQTIVPGTLPLPKGKQWFPTENIVGLKIMQETRSGELQASDSTLSFPAAARQADELMFYGPIYAPNVQPNPLTGWGHQIPYAKVDDAAYNTIEETSYRKLDFYDRVTVKYRVWVQFRGFKPVLEDDFIYARKPVE